MTASVRWRSRAYAPEDHDQVIALLRLALGPGSRGARPDVWRWKHLDNPFGPSLLKVATDGDGQVVGLRALMQWRLVYGEAELKALRAVDTATHPQCRRSGIFKGLTSLLVEEAKEEGFHLIFNTPNRYSLPGYLKLGWRYVGRVHPLVKILDPGSFLMGLARYLVLRKRGPFSLGRDGLPMRCDLPAACVLLNEPGAVERLLCLAKSSRPQEGLHTPHSAQYLLWRYLRHPSLTYHVAQVQEGGALGAWAVVRTNVRAGLREVVLCDMALGRTDLELCKRLLDGIRAQVRADYMVAYFPSGSFLDRSLRRCGFRPVPRVGMNFVVRPLASHLPVDALQPGQWALTLGDLELF